MNILVEISVILTLVPLNGVFAMSEFAIVSAKRARPRLPRMRRRSPSHWSYCS